MLSTCIDLVSNNVTATMNLYLPVWVGKLPVEESIMRKTSKFKGIIAIMVIIAAGLCACITVGPAPEPDEETLAFRNTLSTAAWASRILNSPPSLAGFIKLPGNSEEIAWFQRALARSEDDDGREVTVTSNGEKTTRKLIYMAPDTWYELTAPQIPGITYYYYRPSGTISVVTMYKSDK